MINYDETQIKNSHTEWINTLNQCGIDYFAKNPSKKSIQTFFNKFRKSACITSKDNFIGEMKNNQEDGFGYKA